MSHFADAIARMTIDKDFARDTRRQPEKVATLYGLTAEEARKLRELADAAVSERVAALRTLLAQPAAVPVEGPTNGLTGLPTLLTMPLTPLPAAGEGYGSPAE
ncbi:hypothetical protein [Hamadaea tsunoensis]|uniref:hypothetical protein n=1 Tax=Hamadaea tsunoensis TaxID=53368 RepID=UPI0004139F3D|nr:hypothetical protein [Hamadaea tsunoensis]